MQRIKIATAVMIVAALAVFIGTVSSIVWMISSIRNVEGIGSAVTLLICVWGFAALFLMNYKLYCKYHMSEGQTELHELFRRHKEVPTGTDVVSQQANKTQSQELVTKSKQGAYEPYKTVPNDPDVLD